VAQFAPPIRLLNVILPWFWTWPQAGKRQHPTQLAEERFPAWPPTRDF